MSLFKPIDAHVHLDDSRTGSARSAVDALLASMDMAKVERSVILHLRGQRWSAEECGRAIAAHPRRLLGLVNLHPKERNAPRRLRECVLKLGFSGLKLHPRLDRYPVDHPSVFRLVRAAGALDVPVIVDAFPDGDWLMQGFDPLAFARLAAACPKTRIVAAHMGGHHVLDFLMLAKRLPNLYFDTSYSLLYYRSSSVPKDIAYAVKSLHCERVFYGSDYPDRPIKDALKQSLSLLKTEGLDTQQLRRIFRTNAEGFFPWKDR
ncbi:MAG: amidohydrolase family protein [Elusimicrobiota bacterium]|jgi:predicted TIM-barrel fold metal-dependent hydrolase